MRSATRFLAAVRQSAPPRLLEPGTPTGLTGLRTHPSPRSSLLYLYSRILNKCEQIPEHSVYRQATEAQAKKRLAIVESVRPPGYDSWEKRVLPRMQELTQGHDQERLEKLVSYGGNTFVRARMWEEPKDDREVDWNGEPLWETTMGAKTDEAAEKMIDSFQREYMDVVKSAHPVVEREPQWTVAQIQDIERQIGAGLIEEVIQVAEGEARLMDTMIEHKVWEDLVEKAPEGQWTYFERKPQS